MSSIEDRLNYIAQMDEIPITKQDQTFRISKQDYPRYAAYFESFCFGSESCSLITE